MNIKNELSVLVTVVDSTGLIAAISITCTPSSINIPVYPGANSTGNTICSVMNPTLYQEIVGVKCDMSKLYSADNIDTLSDDLFNYASFNMVSDYIKNHPDYETKYKDCENIN